MKLELRDITKKFGDFAANEDISLTVNPGEIVALLGENGAGKSTLMNVVYGLLQPTSGQMFIDDVQQTFDGPGDAMAAGIGMVHQHFMLIPPFTVAENVMLGHEHTKGAFLDLDTAREEVRRVSSAYNLHVDPDALVEAVSRIRPRRDNQTDKRLDVFNAYYNNPNAFTKMSISALDGVYFVNIKDIVRFEAEDNYTHFMLKTGNKITASKTIKAYEDTLLRLNFVRVHKKHIVNMNYMKTYIKGEGGYLVLENGETIEVSRRKKATLMDSVRRLYGEI